MKPKTLKSIIVKNSGNLVDVEFVKKDGTLRKISGTIKYVPGHDKENPAAHVEKYVTLVCTIDGKQTWRNVNTETIQSLAIDGKTLYKDA